MPEQFCRCRTEGIATLTPEAQDVFGKTYAEPDELWLGVFFSPSDASQAAGRKYLQRFRARTVDRDPEGSDAVAPAQIAALGDWEDEPYAYQPTLVENGGNTSSSIR